MKSYTILAADGTTTGIIRNKSLIHIQSTYTKTLQNLQLLHNKRIALYCFEMYVEKRKSQV